MPRANRKQSSSRSKVQEFNVVLQRVQNVQIDCPESFEGFNPSDRVRGPFKPSTREADKIPLLSRRPTDAVTLHWVFEAKKRFGLCVLDDNAFHARSKFKVSALGGSLAFVETVKNDLGLKAGRTSRCDRSRSNNASGRGSELNVQSSGFEFRLTPRFHVSGILETSKAVRE